MKQEAKHEGMIGGRETKLKQRGGGAVRGGVGFYALLVTKTNDVSIALLFQTLLIRMRARPQVLW